MVNYHQKGVRVNYPHFVVMHNSSFLSRLSVDPKVLLLFDGFGECELYKIIFSPDNLLHLIEVKILVTYEFLYLPPQGNIRRGTSYSPYS